MNEELEKVENSAQILKAMTEILHTALEGDSSISDNTLAWYTCEMLDLAETVSEGLKAIKQ